MKLIKPYYQLLTELNGNNILKSLEQFGRICYKSEDKITPDSSQRFCSNILTNQHLSVIEHISLSVKFIVSRSFTHELVRHRLCSFSQESTRYCNYKNMGLTFILPHWVDIREGEYQYDDPLETKDLPSIDWAKCMWETEHYYLSLISKNCSPQHARAVLPNSLKTEIITTTNLREWRHILSLRTSNKAHPEMREIMLPLMNELKSKIPIIFDNL